MGVWGAVLAIDVGGREVELTLREWVNSGLMTLFFFVLGLEARRDAADRHQQREHQPPALAKVAEVGRRGGELPRVRPRQLGRGGLGRRDVDRHGVRAGTQLEEAKAGILAAPVGGCLPLACVAHHWTAVTAAP